MYLVKIIVLTMKKLLFNLLFFFIGIASLFSCGITDTQRTLEDVESYIMEHPDSALTVLEAIDRSFLKRDCDRAYHALLYAMALDKNFIDVCDDSIAQIAVDYYSRKGPGKYHARARYYLGLSHYYSGDYRMAILELTKAEDIAESSDSLYWAYIETIQAYAYSNTHNDEESLKCFRQAFDLFSALSYEYYRSISELDLAKAYFNNKDYSKADSLLCDLTEAENIDLKVYLSALQYKAFSRVSGPHPNYQEAVMLYDTLINEYEYPYMSNKDYWAYAYALVHVGRQDESTYLTSYLSVSDSSGTANYWQYRIEKAKGHTSDALSMLEASVSQNDKEVTGALKQSLALSQKEYYESQYRESVLRVRVKNQTIIILISSAALLVFIISYLAMRYISRQKMEKARLMEYVEEINRQLEQFKTEAYPSLKRRFIALYKSRFEAVGTLCEQYLQNKDRVDVERIMYHKMLLMIEDIRNDKVRRIKFESVLDSELDGIMTHFRNEMPKSKEWEVTMFSYLVAGFDATMISRLMDMPLNNVYSYKRRLKIKIADKNPEHASQFLEMI